jgi:hypothetical protein
MKYSGVYMQNQVSGTRKRMRLFRLRWLLWKSKTALLYTFRQALPVC